MPAPAAMLAAGLPAIEEVARQGLALAQTPVLGWERVETFTEGKKRPHVVVQRSSATVRAWELGLVVFGVPFVLWAMSQATDPKTNEPFWFPGKWTKGLWFL